MGTILGIFLVVVVGSIILDTFPQLQPLWEECKSVISSLYQASEIKFGTVATVLIIIAIGVLFATSSSHGGKKF